MFPMSVASYISRVLQLVMVLTFIAVPFTFCFSQSRERDEERAVRIQFRQKLKEIRSEQADDAIHGDDIGLACAVFFDRLLKRGTGRPRDFESNVGRFIGFLEAKLGLTVPKWWRETLLESSQEFTLFPNVPAFADQRARAWDTVIHGEAIRIDDNGVRINGRIVAKTTLLDLRKKSVHTGWVSLAANKESTFAAYHDKVPYSFSLTKLSKDGVELWNAIVWADCAHGATGSLYHHNVDIRATRKQVVVFGATPSSVYVEGFDLATGANTFRFNSAVWNDN